MSNGGFSDELLGLDWAHRRELKNIAAQGQAVVDQQDRRIAILQRRLSATQRQLAASTATVDSMKAERGARNMRRAMQVLRTRQH